MGHLCFDIDVTLCKRKDDSCNKQKVVVFGIVFFFNLIRDMAS